MPPTPFPPGQVDESGSTLRQRATPTATPPPSSSSSPRPDDALLPANGRESKRRSHPLLEFAELPGWMKEFESEFTIEGYRREQGSWQGCWWSAIGYLHNETVNIHTHLLPLTLPLLLLLSSHLHPSRLLLPNHPSLAWGDKAVLSIFLAAAVVCLGMSACYHTLSCHSKRVANRWNQLDYIGIVVLIVGSNYPAIYYGFYCDRTLQIVYTSIISILGSMAAYVVLHPTYTTGPYRWARTLIFLSLGLSAIVPVSHALGTYGWARAEREMGLGWLFGSGALYIAGALLYAVRFPERAFPRTFDFFGSSHQIFHCCVVVAAWMHFKCVMTAIEWHHGVMAGTCTA